MSLSATGPELQGLGARYPVSFAECLLFEKIEWSEDFDNVYFAKNDHRWVTFISLKTIGLLLSAAGAKRGLSKDTS